MLIKIGKKIYDSKKQPITIVLQDGDLENVYKLEDNLYRICISSEELTSEELKILLSFESDPKHGA